MTSTDQSATRTSSRGESASANASLGATHTQMANAIRALSMDAVQAAKSGHPGMPMGTADIATVLFTKFMKFDPLSPNWADRDRFVLSAGHGSMLLYSLLHLLGYEDMTIEELKNFRQLGAKTAGHPEYGHAQGIETTTGPLGQGISNAVGFALGERMMNAKFGNDLVDHYTYVIAGDGCLMEGISHEAISMAGHLKLNKLIVMWDDNSITIDGKVELSESGDQIARFQAANWNTIAIDGHDPEAIEAAISTARQSDKPTMIACKTIIGKGSPNKQGTSGIHGAPLGEDEIVLARKELGWTDEPFVIPAPIRDAWRVAALKAAKAHKTWETRLAATDASKRVEFERRMAGDTTKAVGVAINDFKKKMSAEKPSWATRKCSEAVLNVVNPIMPENVGGSADLTGSNNTKSKDQLPVQAPDYDGSYIYYGVREHGMAAAMNGLTLHGGFIPYGGTFMVFTDYCRPAIRLSALMGIRTIYVMTHDSIGLGEDGPTHQPVEHLSALRAIPNLMVFRPCDAIETAECWQLSLETKTAPSILALTRQGLPTQRTEHTDENLCARGAYELSPAKGVAKVTLLATGSEVKIAMAAQEQLQADGIAARVVSVPCQELFDTQSREYREQTLGEGTVRVAIEAGTGMSWDKYLGFEGAFVGMTGFGASAPIDDLYNHFGITAEAAVAAAKERLQND
ncbi:MAG: transketolase [Rhodobiaceae bacterium]|nr:transketolase [Rhodobiaceae bacterium]